MPLQDADVKEITSRLDVLIKLAAALFARDLSNIDAIVKLDKMELSREHIANALGVTTQNVAQQLYISRKANRRSTESEDRGVGAKDPPGAAAASEEVPQ